MKYIFIVQGEGRGHMTQAITLYKMLTKNGHKVSQVIVGKSRRRNLPSFFLDQISSPIVQLDSPNFATDKNNKSVKVFKTIRVNLLKVRTYLKSVKKIDSLIQQDQPDVVVNFYDFLGGLYYLIKRPKAKHIAIAHQFFLEHSSFTFPKGRLFDRTSLKFGNAFAGFRANKKLCLSFQEFGNELNKKLIVVPPLLREEIKAEQTIAEEHFLVYMVNDGYASEVEKFHKENPEIPIHCFWDRKGEPEVLKKDKNLSFHQLNDKKFIQYMASCKGYLTTAGFESVCEAMYMGKPVLMVPVKGHYEQSCNAVDASNAGAGVSSEIFNLEILLDYLPSYESVKGTFRTWCNEAETHFLKNLTEDVN